MGLAQWRALARREDVLNAHSLGNLSAVPYVFSNTLFCTAALLVDRISLQAICRVCNNYRGTQLFVRC